MPEHTHGSEGRLSHDVVSPVTGRVIDTVRLSDREEILRTVAGLAGPPWAPPRAEVRAFLNRMHGQLVAHEEALIEATILETGFILGDSRDIVAGAIEFVRDFGLYAESQQPTVSSVPHSYASASTRHMRITHRPYRWIAAMVPQNASLALSITILASALYAGSRVLLRPSLQCASSGVLLADLIRKSEPPTSVVVVNSLAQDFLEACCQSEHIDLIHYIGSNRYAMSVLNDALAAGKHCLLDGQGNGVLYVDRSFPLDDAVRLITTGATRFNGLTCTSVNGVLVEAGLHAQLRDALVASFGALEVGEPHDARTQIGPLFSAEHAAGLVRDLRAGPSSRLRCGGMASGAYFRPAVVEGVSPTDTLVREGVFGPALWIQPVREDEVFAWLRSNLFPLSDTVLSTRSDVIETFTLNSKAARICVNEDPSVESMFEPWGGYLNPVSNWIDKYRQSYQIDGRPSVLAERFRTFGAGGV